MIEYKFDSHNFAGFHDLRSIAILVAGLMPMISFGVVFAQPCTARSSFRLENNMSGSLGTPNVFAGGNIWLSTVPLVVQASNANHNALGCQSEATATARADYGNLSFTASGSGNNVQGNGCFLKIDEYIGGAAKVETNDRLTITSATLPANTPVDVRISMSFYGGGAVVDAQPAFTSSARVDGSATVSGSYAHTLGGPGQVSFTVTSRVGGTVTIHPALFVSMSAGSLLGGTPRSASMWCNFRVLTSYVVLTPGAAATSCAASQPCVSDLDNGSGSGMPDGGVGIEDLLYYLNQYSSGAATADVDDGTGTGSPDGGVGIEDLLYYLTRYDAGC